QAGGADRRGRNGTAAGLSYPDEKPGPECNFLQWTPDAAPAPLPGQDQEGSAAIGLHPGVGATKRGISVPRGSPQRASLVLFVGFLRGTERVLVELGPERLDDQLAAIFPILIRLGIEGDERTVVATLVLDLALAQQHGQLETEVATDGLAHLVADPVLPQRVAQACDPLPLETCAKRFEPGVVVLFHGS